MLVFKLQINLLILFSVLPAKKASNLRGSNAALCPDVKTLSGSRSQVKTNGHFTTYMQVKH